MKNYVTKINLNRFWALAVMTALSLIALSSTASAQQFSHRNKATAFAQQSSNNAAANAVFNGGRDLIDDAQWAKAEAAFAQYISSYAQEKNVDAAMYWMAYAQAKLKKFNQSKDTIEKLLKTYEKTIWKEDAELLLAQLPNTPVKIKVDPVVVNVEPVVVAAPVAVAVGQEGPVRIEIQERMAEAQARAQERAKEAQERMQERMKIAQERIKDKTLFKYEDGLFKLDLSDSIPDDDPCEFKVVVLQALFESDPQRGIAVATDWLRAGSGQTATCKRAALTLLARHGGKAVMPTILTVAQNETDLKVRTRAISLLGATNDDGVIDPLRDFALNSQQNEIAEAALYALSQHTGARAATVLADIALSTKPVALRKQAISSIAGRQGEPAVDALFKIYDSTQDIDIRKSVLSGLSRRKSERAGAKLMEVAQRSDNIELRKYAIGAVGRRGGEQAIGNLISWYDSERVPELQDQIMSGFANSNDPRVTDKLIEIAKNPQTPMERRRRAIMYLSNRSKDPKVLKFLEDLLKQ